MTKIKSILWLVLIFLALFSCRDETSIYDRPEWLAGKVYTQVLGQPELSDFASCIEKIGYDKILDVSGSYTVFAPSNEAFKLYFASNPKYKSIDDIPGNELERLVKYHIVQNPWSKIQLRSLDIYGWIDTLDLNNNEPKGFKRETLLLDKDTKYGVSGLGTGKSFKNIIIDTLQSNWYRRVSTDSRKYAPIFYQEYFSINDLNKSDYEFYFNRPFGDANDIHFAGAKVIGDEIPAENGFVYVIDRVVEPLGNAAQILAKQEGANRYTDFLEVMNLFPAFEYNAKKTLEQPGANLGQAVDSLFDLSFPKLTFDFTGEKTSPPSGTFGLPQNVTIRYHHGLMAPTNEAFQQFINEYLKAPNGWGTLAAAPEHIKRIIANTYMSINTIYPSDFAKGFYNGELDIVKLDEAHIVQKEFGSNSTFIGLNEAIVPRAFKSVTGPIYMQRGYSKIMYAIEASGLLSALKRQGQNYMFFVESDLNTSRDSSLLYNVARETFSLYQTIPGNPKEYTITLNDLRTLLLNHIAVDHPRGVARKEFVPNLAGNYIIINNETGIVSGTGITTAGYQGSTPAPETPTVLSETPDNGTTYEIKNWFSFSSPSLFTKMSGDFPKFHALLRKAGLTIDKEYRYNFISDNDFYTVFVPSDEALNNAGVDALPVAQLRNLLLLHFVQGDMIFTDGRKPATYYETARVDENSTEFTTVYTKIHIKPGIDKIEFMDKSGEIYTGIEENATRTNFLTGISGGTGQEVFPIQYNNSVVHGINKVLIKEELDTN